MSVSRTIDAPPKRVREEMEDLESFMLASGFTDATVDGDNLHLENQVGLATVELDLRVFEREGIFETMETVYTVEPVDGGSEITATTEFALDVALVGQILDATVIKRQRRNELTSQFDWLAERLEG